LTPGSPLLFDNDPLSQTSALAAGPPELGVNLSLRIVLPPSIELDPAETFHLILREVALRLFLLGTARSMSHLLQRRFPQGFPLLLTLEQGLFILDVFQNFNKSAFAVHMRFAPLLTLCPFLLASCVARSQGFLDRHFFATLHALDNLSQYSDLSLCSAQVVAPFLLQPQYLDSLAAN
jgi:hypothetical protein